MNVTILAVNALELGLVNDFDLENLRLEDYGELAIPEDLPLHTEVLWPSIFTGTMPDEHGLTRTSAREWGNPVLQLAADIGLKLIPEEYLLPIGKRIQKLGFEREAKAGEAYFNERGIDTIFTGLDARAIDVPGYSQWEDADEIRELMGHDSYDPDDPDLFLEKSRQRFERKCELIKEAVDDDTPLTMGYFQTLDNIQHVFWGNDGLLNEWYREFDDLAGKLLSLMADDDVLIVMSDHGMREGPNGKGEHSDHGYYAATHELGMENIMDLKPAVDKFRSTKRAAQG